MLRKSAIVLAILFGVIAASALFAVVLYPQPRAFGADGTPASGISILTLLKGVFVSCGGMSGLMALLAKLQPFINAGKSIVPGGQLIPDNLPKVAEDAVELASAVNFYLANKNDENAAKHPK